MEESEEILMIQKSSWVKISYSPGRGQIMTVLETWEQEGADPWIVSISRERYAISSNQSPDY